MTDGAIWTKRELIKALEGFTIDQKFELKVSEYMFGEVGVSLECVEDDERGISLGECYSDPE